MSSAKIVRGLELKIACPVEEASKASIVGSKNLDRVVLIAVSTNHQALH
jgi:hypothetical protein